MQVFAVTVVHPRFALATDAEGCRYEAEKIGEELVQIGDHVFECDVWDTDIAFVRLQTGNSGVFIN